MYPSKAGTNEVTKTLGFIDDIGITLSMSNSISAWLALKRYLDML